MKVDLERLGCSNIRDDRWAANLVLVYSHVACEGNLWMYRFGRQRRERAEFPFSLALWICLDDNVKR